MVKEIKTLEAIKIYFSRISYKNSKGKIISLTVGDLLINSFLFFISIPLTLIVVPSQIYKLKKDGISKKYRKYYLYYNKEKK